MVPSFPRLHLAVKAANFDLTNLPGQKTAGRVSIYQSPLTRRASGQTMETLTERCQCPGKALLHAATTSTSHQSSLMKPLRGCSEVFVFQSEVPDELSEKRFLTSRAGSRQPRDSAP